MGAGTLLTVMGLVTTQVPTVYRTVSRPVLRPLTRPDEEPITALVTDDILHVPAGVTSAIEMVAPGQTDEGPVMAEGAAMTVTIFVTVQPEPMTYDIVAVPADMPVTTPDDDPTEATKGEPELHVPPVTESVKAVGSPIQTTDGP
jgi:hypothetical protein